MKGSNRGLPEPLSIVFYSDSSLIGGAEVVLGTLLSELAPEIEATIAGTDPEVVEFIAASRPAASSAVLPPVAGKGDYRGWLANLRGISALRPDIFQANSGGGAAAQHALLAATLLPGVRTVMVEHAATDVDNDLQRHIKSLTNRRLAAHLAPSRASARAIEAISALAPDTVGTIPNGVPDVELRPMPRPSDGVVIGSIGRLQAEKRFDLLIRAVAGFADATLVLVGDGPERRALEALTAELRLGSRVQFTGWRDDARDHLTSFDLFALPSRLESMSLVLIEAGLAGLPVIACRVGGVPEVVQDGDSGLLVAPDDLDGLINALRTLIEDPDLRESMGVRGRRRALQFSPAAMARSYERLYRSISRSRWPAGRR